MLSLVFTAFLFGSLYYSLKQIDEIRGAPTASAIILMRSGIAALILFTLARNRRCRAAAASASAEEQQPLLRPAPALAPAAAAAAGGGGLWASAAALGACHFCANGTIQLGLAYIDGNRASFLVQSSVIMTPALELCCGAPLRWHTALGALLTFVGVLCLSIDGGSRDGGAGPPALCAGDLLCLASGAFWSAYLMVLSAVGEKHDNVQLQLRKNVIMVPLSLSWAAFDWARASAAAAAPLGPAAALWPGWRSAAAWVLIAYAAVFPGVLADMLQQQAQASVSATTANVILSTDAFFAAAMDVIFLHERITALGWLGGLLIVSGAGVASGALDLLRDAKRLACSRAARGSGGALRSTPLERSVALLPCDVI